MPRSAKDTCYHEIKMRILQTELAPGVALDETQLAAQYALSRTPLREVIQRLAGEGYVTLTEHRGAKVSSMDVGVMRTFFQTAPMIYAHVSRLAAEHRTAAQLETLQMTQNNFANAADRGDAGAAALANHSFHALIGAMAHNPYLGASLQRLLIDHTRLSQTFYRPKSAAETTLIEKASAQHDEMIAAIAKRDAGLAMDITLEHWGLSRDQMERYVRPDPLPLDVVSLKEKRNAV
ncbi:MAG: GntR family transcriptional regulator [Pseudomonadota bacterium]